MARGGLLRGALSSSVSAPGGQGQSCIDECSDNMDDRNHPYDIYHRLTERLDEVRTIVGLQSCPGICEAINLLIRFFLFVFHLLA